MQTVDLSRSDAVENKGMKLILGNRDHGNSEITLRTIRRVRPVKTQIIFPCKGGQSLLFVVTDMHANSSSWRNYKSGQIHHRFSEGLNVFCGV